MTRFWSPSSAGIGIVRGRAVWAAQVVTFDMSGSGAVNRCGEPRCGMCADVEGGTREWRVGAVLEHGRCRRGWVCGWKGCREGLPRAAGARSWGSEGGLARSDVVRTGLAGGHFEMLQALLKMGWRAATLSRGCHKWRETCWDPGGYVETIDADQWEGRDELGRVNTA